MNRRYESHANFSFPELLARLSATAGVIPTFKTVSIIPGIECFAPDRTETRSGEFRLPSFLPTIFSKLLKALCTCSDKSVGTSPVRKNSLHASVVIVNPGGTGSPI